MKVLLIGSGGREHAMAWALKKSASVREVICAPGNAGIAEVARCVAVAADEIAKLADLAEAEDVDLVVVGPEAPLVAGLADLLVSRGRAVFGCSRVAAEIEGSKAFSKDLMARHGIASGAYGVFSDADGACLFVDAQFGAGAKKLVVKADGLASGKGVVVCDDHTQARAAVHRMLTDGAHGAASSRIVVEEFLVGREASVMAFVDGERVLALPAAEDHKTVHDDDVGPMTGGMGVVSPTPVLDDVSYARVVRDVLEPTARAMVKEGRPFRGLLYAGLMMTVDGPRVLEFNCRFGDPETQPLMMRLEDDLGALLLSVARGEMPARARFSSKAAVCVVMAAKGYPGPYERGARIEGIAAAEALGEVKVFHAGTTRMPDGTLTTSGGRVLGVTATGSDVDAARALAYRAVEAVRFDGEHHRRDIGARKWT